ncbi:MAG: LEA type 2 family protein [Thiogranum sp.]
MADMIIRTRALILLFLTGLTACAGLPGKPEAPRVNLAGLQLVSVELFEQRYKVDLRVKNPNAFELPIRGIDFRMDINDQAFADGVSNQSVNIPAYGERIVSLEVSSGLVQVFRQLQSLEKGRSPGFSYRIEGSVAIGDSGMRLPFDYAGEMGLSKPARPANGKNAL